MSDKLTTFGAAATTFAYVAFLVATEHVEVAISATAIALITVAFWNKVFSE